MQKILTVNQQERTDLSLYQIYEELETIWKEGEEGKDEEGNEIAIYNSFLGIEWQEGGGKKALLPKYKTFTGKEENDKLGKLFVRSFIKWIAIRPLLDEYRKNKSEM